MPARSPRPSTRRLAITDRPRKRAAAPRGPRAIPIAGIAGALGALLATACGSTGSTAVSAGADAGADVVSPGADGRAPMDAGGFGSDAAADAGPRGFMGQPCSQYRSCVLRGSLWDCDCGGGSAPACPASVGPDQACDPGYDGGGCQGCSQGAALSCVCAPGPALGVDAGRVWTCVGDGTVCSM